MLVEPLVRGAPGCRALLAQPRREIFAQQRMRVDGDENRPVPDDGQKLRLLQPRQLEIALRLGETDERLGQPVDRRRPPERFETARVGWAIEKAHQPQHRQGAHALLALALEAARIGVHDEKGVAVIRLREPEQIAPADVASVGVAEIGADQIERQRMALHRFNQRLELALSARDPQRPQQRGARFFRKPRQRDLRRRHCRGGLEIGDGIARRDEAEASASEGQALEQRGEAVVLELSLGRRGRRILQGLEPIKNEQRAPAADLLGEPASLFIAA